MSSQVYNLISPTFRQLEKPNENLCEKLADSLRYFLHRLISCRHWQLSRPFTHDGRTYRSCASCGMRREFDLEAWKTRRSYYFPRVRTRHIKPASIATDSKLRLIKLKRAS